MRLTSSHSRLNRAVTVAALVVLILGVGACGQARDFIAKQSDKTEAPAAEGQEAVAREAERLAAEIRLQEEKAFQEEEAARKAEAEALAAREALEAAERQLAEKEALLARREEELRQQRALQEEKDRLAARQAAIEEKERTLFEHQQELEAREVNVALAEEELREDVTGETPGAYADGNESEEWVGGVTPVDRGSDSGEDVSDVPYSEDGDSEKDGDAEALPEASGYSSTASLQPGKVMEVEILETVSSRTHNLGDNFSARLVQDLRAEDGTLVVAAGASVVGEVTEVTPLRKVGGRASIAIEFTRIVLAPGESVEIRASVSELGADRSKDRKKIIGATVAGAILGRVLGGKGGENAVLGAAVGAAAGTAAAARAKGKDAVIPAGEMVALQLEEVVTVEIDMTGIVDQE